MKWYKPVSDTKLGRGWIGPYVVIQVLGDGVYKIQSHPDNKPKTVHVDHLKVCHGYAERKNWVLDPSFIPAEKRVEPDEAPDSEMADILDQEGEDDFDRKIILQDKIFSKKVKSEGSTLDQETDKQDTKDISSEKIKTDLVVENRPPSRNAGQTPLSGPPSEIKRPPEIKTASQDDPSGCKEGTTTRLGRISRPPKRLFIEI